MKLKLVVVDLEIPPALKRRALRIGLPIVLLLTASVAYAASVHTWNSGDALSAADLNSSFQAVSIVSSGGNSISVNGVFWGLTSSFSGSIADPTGGSAVGYQAAKLQCEQVASCASASKTAHVCDASEISRSAQIGALKAGSEFRYATAVNSLYYSYANNAYYQVEDCHAFQSSAHTDLMVMLEPNGSGGISGPDYDYCDGQHPIACCN